MTNTPLPSDLFAVISPILTDKRKQRLQTVASQRLPWLRCVLQDIHNVHNISACMRSCEALGIGEVDILTLLNPQAEHSSSTAPTNPRFHPSSVACGISHWLNIRQFDSPQAYAHFLTQHNFKLFAGIPHPSTHQTQESVPQSAATTQHPPMNLSSVLHESWQHDYKIAVLFGNERAGIHPDWQPYISGYFSIPTTGFVESFNVSVAVAITLHQLTHEAKQHYKSSSRFYFTATQINHQLNRWIAQSYPHWQTLYTKHLSSS